MRAQRVLRRDGTIMMDLEPTCAKWIPSGSQTLRTGMNSVSEIGNPMPE
jgi:hypothetical protein